jgi:tetrapyrrole methylase family protein/MazG family protein
VNQNPPTSTPKETSPNPGLDRAVDTVRALRTENGCPWDRAQTHQSLRTYLLEETYEVLDALDRLGQPGAYEELKDELGDLLLQVLLHSQIAEDDGKFNVNDVARNLAEKLVRRHPHVFGGAKVESADDVSRQWAKIKQKEKKKESALDGIPSHLPALQKSLKVIERVSKVGFQWPDLKGPLDKVREELGEFLAEVEKLGVSVNRDTELTFAQKTKLEAELGDLFFTLSNVAYFLQLNPEDALRSMLARFERRFRHVEKRGKEAGKVPEDMTLAEMDTYWDEAKALEKK